MFQNGFMAELNANFSYEGFRASFCDSIFTFMRYATTLFNKK